MSKPAAVITTLEDSASRLDQHWVSAYLRTTYRVLTPPFDRRIGETNKAFDHWLENQGADQFTFLTAWNPFSAALTPAENECRNRELESELLELGVAVYPGLGIGDDPTWSPEASFCALDLPPEEAVRLGQKFAQNALVYGRKGSVPELWWLVGK
ncbi:MAG: DUF3293 domain-containing protein [Saprospiraceae bacterium]